MREPARIFFEEGSPKDFFFRDVEAKFQSNLLLGSPNISSEDNLTDNHTVSKGRQLSGLAAYSPFKKGNKSRNYNAQYIAVQLNPGFPPYQDNRVIEHDLKKKIKRISVVEALGFSKKGNPVRQPAQVSAVLRQGSLITDRSVVLNFRIHHNGDTTGTYPVRVLLLVE